MKSGLLKNKCTLTNDVWTKLIGLAREGWQITSQFIFSHCGTIRNENVDSFADFALLNCNLRQNKGAIPLSAVKAKVKRSMRDAEEQMYKKNDHGTAYYLRKQFSIRGFNLKNINFGLSIQNP